jgi:hypothetical protein
MHERTQAMQDRTRAMHERPRAMHERPQPMQERPRGRRRPRRRWALAAIVAAAVALPLVAFVVTRVHSGDGLSDKLRTDLAAEVQTILENSPAILQVVQASHDHDGAGPERVMCAVDPFGIAPETATSASQVQWVYAQHLCALGTPGTPWNFASKSAGPVAVSLRDTNVVLPAPRADYRTQVRQMIPAKYLTQAFGSFQHPDVVTRLRQQFTDQVSSATPVAASPSP